jgi:hypothetical protein
VVSIDDGKIIFDKGEVVRNGAALHLDQGIAVTSHASQAKTVDQVIASVAVRAFSQANEAQFYVSMLLSLEHTELPGLIEWQLLLDAVLSDDDNSLLPAKDFPLFTALKALFLDSSANSSLGHPVKLDDLPCLISDLSRARWAMHVFTDSKVALRNAVTRPSKRLSSWELLNLPEKDSALQAELARQRAKAQKKQQEIAYER